jgi:hypothetical protein
MNPPRYRLARRHAGTAVFGLRPGQLVVLGVTGAAAVALGLAATAASLAAGVVVVAAGAWLAWGSWGGQPSLEAVASRLGMAGRTVAGSRRWTAALPWFATATSTGRAEVGGRAPRGLAGLELWAVERPGWATSTGVPGTRVDPGTPVALVVDRRARTATAAVVVQASGFALAEANVQHQRIADWARLLGQFGTERAGVVRLTWHDTTGADPVVHAAHAAVTPAEAAPVDPARGVVDEVAAGAVAHQLVVTVTVAASASRRGGPTLVGATLAAAQSLRERLGAIAVAVSAPLSPADLALTTRQWSDPVGTDAGLVGVARQVLDALGVADATRLAPMAVAAEWDHVRVDASYHRSLAVTAWPAGDLGPRWLEALMLAPLRARTVTVVLEPVDRRASRRHLNADAVRLDGEIRQRHRHGFRVPAEVQRARRDVEARDAELHHGFAEYRYGALVNVAAASLAALDDATRAVTRVAAECGIELRPLDARHDVARYAGLPLGRAL